ncbi:neuroligin-2-like, partial [Homarus americanus]|uniref:neuroligin-2-like n=1 Tax=Homarus americanus TaxID=6706 RepID=UPI001C47486E
MNERKKLEVGYGQRDIKYWIIEFQPHPRPAAPTLNYYTLLGEEVPERSVATLQVRTEAKKMVTTASRRDHQRHPVMVYIHGESYEWNSGNPYDGSVLASVGRVVVVTVNFRLGVLGFLNTNENPYLRSITNYGLMDQIAALHWLKENIAEFGGDPENVTIFGHGTGAACINFLMTSKAVPKNPRLFHRAVLMSGSSLAPWSLVHDPMKYTRQLTHSINCSHTPLGDELKKCLRTKNLHLIMKAQVEVSEARPSPSGEDSRPGRHQVAGMAGQAVTKWQGWQARPSPSGRDGRPGRHQVAGMAGQAVTKWQGWQ